MLKSKLDFQNEILENDKSISLADAIKLAKTQYKTYSTEQIDLFWAQNPTAEFFGKTYTRDQLEAAMGKMGANEQVLVSL